MQSPLTDADTLFEQLLQQLPPEAVAVLYHSDEHQQERQPIAA